MCTSGKYQIKRAKKPAEFPEVAFSDNLVRNVFIPIDRGMDDETVYKKDDFSVHAGRAPMLDNFNYHAAAG